MGESDINAVNAILDIHTIRERNSPVVRRLSIIVSWQERRCKRDIIILSAFILGN